MFCQGFYLCFWCCQRVNNVDAVENIEFAVTTSPIALTLLETFPDNLLALQFADMSVGRGTKFNAFTNSGEDQ